MGQKLKIHFFEVFKKYILKMFLLAKNASFSLNRVFKLEKLCNGLEAQKQIWLDELVIIP